MYYTTTVAVSAIYTLLVVIGFFIIIYMCFILYISFSVLSVLHCHYTAILCFCSCTYVCIIGAAVDAPSSLVVLFVFIDT